MKEFGALL